MHHHIAFNYQNADALRTAHGGYVDKTGVCRDFAHLAITLCRCMNIPARYSGLSRRHWRSARPRSNGFQRLVRGLSQRPLDTFDARHNTPRIGRILMATGRDATDVAFSTSFGPSLLARFEVVTEEVLTT